MVFVGMGRTEFKDAANTCRLESTKEIREKQGH